jgi:hypothetical protein
MLLAENSSRNTEEMTEQEVPNLAWRNAEAHADRVFGPPTSKAATPLRGQSPGGATRLKGAGGAHTVPFLEMHSQSHEFTYLLIHLLKRVTWGSSCLKASPSLHR